MALGDQKLTGHIFHFMALIKSILLGPQNQKTIRPFFIFKHEFYEDDKFLGILLTR